MSKIAHLVLALTLNLAALLMIAEAQTTTISTVNLSTERDRVLLSAQGDITELRLEVVNPSGEVIFDSGAVSASTVEWPMRDSHGARVADGVYLCAISYRNSSGKLRKRTEQVTVTAAPPSAETSESAPLAPTTITGSGTAGQLSKFTSSSAIGDSIVTESAGQIGVGTTTPTATLHVNNSAQPASSAGNGTAATQLLQTSGGKGGNTTGTTGQVGGAGASISLLAGTGGDAPAGSKRGNGGSITLQPGGPGGGLGSGGVTGNLLLAPTGGNVGVGTTTPASKLTVAGVIQSTTGGVKFPDNTVQTTASKGGTITDVSAGTGLTGGGTTGAVTLGLASGGVGNTQLAANAVTATKIASGQVVKSLNSLTDNVTLTAGTNVTITPSGNTLTIAAPSAAFTGVTHDSTLMGSGTSSMPLGVAAPLTLSSSSTNATLTVSDTNGDGVDGSGFNGVSGTSTLSDGNGVVGEADTGANAFGVWGKSNTGNGVVGETFASSGLGGYFLNNSGPGLTGVVVRGLSASGSVSDIHPGNLFDDAGGEFAGPFGVIGAASTDDTDGTGVVGTAQGYSGTGVFGYASSTDPNAGSFGVYGETASSSPNSYAGYFGGNVSVTGTLTSGVKDFKIDHPMDPANKYLYHTSVESPDMMNIYNGTVTLDQNGEATVRLPDYFEALNRDFRYQLTA
ncbi:MAG: hypothetical protein JOY92_07040, partial [Verrucomicrobia bacterium]|nr:hypothetical protein [Verrucomicrobiota bacterium]